MFRCAALGAGLVLAIALAWFSWRQVGPGAAVNPPALLLQVQQLRQLTTVRYRVEKVIGLREPKQPVGEESILLVMQAVVEAGVDLAGMHEGDVAVRGDRTIVVRLPPPRIFHVVVDEKATQVWDRQKTWWAPWIPFSKDLESRARLEGVAAIEESARGMGILAQAQQNAETAIRTLLGLGGVKNVLVVMGGS